MILLLDTSTPVCRLTLVSDGRRNEYEWQADRELAKNLLGWLQEQLAHEGKVWQDITGIGVFSGPGSFTGLRIGITVLNTLADSLHVPIVGEQGDDWQNKALDRLNGGENDRIALPYYGSDANITTPRK
jgi:tRNA threonylcarbamoyladenosine biosynthesis protein TsaB